MGHIVKAMDLNGSPAAAAAAPGATAMLAAYVAALRYEMLPSAVVGKTRECVLDALGCMVFGATLP